VKWIFIFPISQDDRSWRTVVNKNRQRSDLTIGRAEVPRMPASHEVLNFESSPPREMFVGHLNQSRHTDPREESVIACNPG